MVTVKSYFLNQNNEGKTYVCLELIGEIEILQSKQSGKFYAAVKKCKIPTTIDEATAKLMIGREIGGTIAKKDCAAYDYTVHATGEVVTLTHKYEYQP